MVQYKLTYFDVRGLAEVSRLILHYADQKFEDERISQDDWPKLKSSKPSIFYKLCLDTPFGQLPVLTVDGVQIAQSMAIARFLGKRHGLAGKDDVEAALLDSLADLHKDFTNEGSTWFRVALGQTLIPAVEKFLPLFVKALKSSGGEFFAKSGISWVDFYYANGTLTLKNMAPEILSKYPELVAHCERVHALPQLKSYLSNRTDSKV